MNSLSDIIYESIDDKFAKAKYGDFDVIIIKSNSYIIVTRLCEGALSKNGEPKQFRVWKKLIISEELIKEVSFAGVIPPGKLFEEFQTSGRVSEQLYSVEERMLILI